MNALLQTLAFETPLALWGLLALPVIWWLLRFIPPRPQSIPFPPLRILLSLKNQQQSPDRTPWWLLALRLLLAGFLILAVAHPFTSKGTSNTKGSGPLLLIVDDGWAAAKNWAKRQDALITILNEAQAGNRTVTIATTAPTDPKRDIKEQAASDAISDIRALAPKALPTDRIALLTRLKSANIKPNQIIWLSDGIDASSANRFASELGANLTTIKLSENSPIALAPPTIEGSDIKITALRNADGPATAIVQAIANNGRILDQQNLAFNGNRATGKLNLPIELRNEVQSIVIAGENHAGAKQLLDDRWRRKTVAIQSSEALATAQPLLSPLHYITKALEPYADLREPATPEELKSSIDQGLSMLVLSDIGNMNQDSHDAIVSWVEKGGVLVRFAGPHLANTTDDLLPVKLREGDRNLSSTLSWETPQAIQSVSEKSPFAGLVIDSRITVSRQVLAEPDANLPDKTWVSLADGTPLITAAKRGKGLIILFHVTSNADWSNLVLSGTFVDMLQRITDLAPAAGSISASTQQLVVDNTFSLRLA